MHRLTVTNLSPAMNVRRAETFIPWKLPGTQFLSLTLHILLSCIAICVFRLGYKNMPTLKRLSWSCKMPVVIHDAAPCCEFAIAAAETTRPLGPLVLAGSADVKQMLDDLGSLSEQGMAPESADRGAERWKWLRPWAWVSGMAWRQKGASRPPAVELTLHIHGSGLETCRSVQVGALLKWRLLHRG